MLEAGDRANRDDVVQFEPFQIGLDRLAVEPAVTADQPDALVAQDIESLRHECFAVAARRGVAGTKPSVGRDARLADKGHERMMAVSWSGGWDCSRERSLLGCRCE